MCNMENQPHNTIGNRVGHRIESIGAASESNFRLAALEPGAYALHQCNLLRGSQTPHQATRGGGRAGGRGPRSGHMRPYTGHMRQTFQGILGAAKPSDERFPGLRPGSQPPGKVVLGFPKNLDSGWGKDQMTPLGIEPASFAEVH